MVFGMNKRERRVPDLSRYDYHYQNREDYNKSPRLSAAAAHAASVGAYTPRKAQSQPQRSQSMTHSTSQAIKRGPTNRGPSRVPKSAPGHNYRSYSLRSQSSAQPRRDSLNSSSSIARARNGNNSRANSITVKTTEVRDPQGRTQSITRRTIRRANGYEYVETTTTTTQAIPIVDAEKHFDQFSGNYVMQDDGIEELSEEEQPGPENHTGHAYAALTAPVGPHSGLLSEGSDGEVPLDQTSSISQFSDALEYVPERANRQNRRTTKSVRRAPTSGSRKPVQTAPQPRQQQPKRALSEKEMYAKAYAIAQQNVYKTDNVSEGVGAVGAHSRMGQRTLRDTPTATVNGGSAVSNVPSTKLRSNRISSFFQRNGTNQDDAAALSAPAAAEKPHIEVPKSPLPSAPVVTSKPKLSDEEMYRQALAIAQEKYGQNQTQRQAPVKATPVEPPTPANQLVQPASKHEPEEPISQKAIQRSNSDVEEEDSDMFEHPEATTATKTTTPEANGGTQIAEWDRYDMEHPEPEGTKAGIERRSKFKNMFEKVKQFSIENSGYQPPKELPKKEHTVEAQATEEINIVQVAPLQRNQSTSSHGASTTRNVEDSLESTNRHFDDQASATSFHKSLKKKVVEEQPPDEREQRPATSATTNTTKTKAKKTKNGFFKKLFNRS